MPQPPALPQVLSRPARTPSADVTAEDIPLEVQERKREMRKLVVSDKLIQLKDQVRGRAAVRCCSSLPWKCLLNT